MSLPPKLPAPRSSNGVVLKDSAALPAVPDERQGRYDKDVEIFRGGKFFDGRLLHEVMPGDCFCTKERPSLWLKCLTPIKRSSSSSIFSRHEERDPTFSLQGLEVLQAKPTPTVERVVQPALPVTPQPKRLVYDDVADVDFKEI